MFLSYKEIVFTVKTCGINTRNHHAFDTYRQILLQSGLSSAQLIISFCRSRQYQSTTKHSVRNNLTQSKWWISKFQHSFLTLWFYEFYLVVFDLMLWKTNLIRALFVYIYFSTIVLAGTWMMVSLGHMWR